MHNAGGDFNDCRGKVETVFLSLYRQIRLTSSPPQGRRFPTEIKNRVRTICTPGETVDVLVTEWGIAANPGRTDLLERFAKAKLPVHSIEKLREKAERLCGKARPIPEGERIVGIVEYRDGTIIDVVRAKA